MPGVSVALATFNGEKYLAPLLDSLARQSRPPAELVISDDRSTDRTVEIAQAFAARAPFPVRIVTNERQLGFRDNFMQAVAHCGSDLVAFCDQDDIWEPEKLAVMERPFDDPDVLLAFHNATLIDEKDHAIGLLYQGNDGVVISESLGRHPWLVVPGFTQVFRRSLTRFSSLHSVSRDADWPGEPLAHDRWFYFLASVLGRIAFVRNPLVRYRQHGDNAYGLYTDRQAHLGRLGRGEEFIRTAAAAAKNRAEVLQQLRALLTAAGQERSSKGIAYYETLSWRLDQRTQVYAAPSYFARLGTFFSLARQGAYRNTSASARFGWGDLLMDGFLAVPFGPRLRRLLPWCIAWVEKLTGRSRLVANAGQKAERPASHTSRERASKE
jgi:glycosyltransferase involved in cell wall biosynthesis